ncbi:hypothetical protein [Glutamicibacter creatinolyticus]|uniref:hypothetical protein n=1 Tax=Glutamicibacter creatinolyticus TaxID=162496 RepID=UPI0031CE427C
MSTDDCGSDIGQALNLVGPLLETGADDRRWRAAWAVSECTSLIEELFRSMPGKILRKQVREQFSGGPQW